jgi:patatin-like phospholipase/acyl hydrolase
LSEIVKNSSDKIQKYSLEEHSGHIRLLLKIYELQLSKYRIIQADQRMLNNLTISIFSLFSGGAIGTIVTLLINLNQK